MRCWATIFRSEKVIVIGDGNVAMDVARLALRLGSEAVVISGVPREEMACFQNEFDDAEREGTVMHYLAGAVGFIGSESGLRVFSVQGWSGRRKAKRGGILPFRSSVTGVPTRLSG